MKYNVPLEIKENEAVSELLQFIEPNTVVLEFGCANGRMTKYMTEELNCRVYIVEYEEAAFNDAKKYAVEGICGDIMQYQWLEAFKNVSFDYIIFADVLEHLSNPDKVLRETKSLLKYDGKVLISVPNIGHNDILIKLMQGRFEYTDIGLLDNTHIHFFAAESIDNFCTNAGFSVVQKKYIKCNTGESEQFRGEIPEISPIYRSIIDERKNGKVYQFLLCLQKMEYVCENHVQPKYEDDILSTIFGRIYFDYGQGYNESDAMDIEIAQNKEGFFECNIDLKVEDSLHSIRFDPTEGKNCLVREASAFSEEQEINIEFVNSLKGDSKTILIGPDPQCVIRCDDVSNSVIKFYIKYAVEGTVAYSESMEVLNYISNSIEEANRELNDKIEQQDEKVYLKIYFDSGEGYNEEEVILLEPIKEGDYYVCNSIIQITGQMQRLRIDPVEGKSCFVSNISIKAETKEIDYFCINAIESEGKIFLIDNDPQIEVLNLDNVIELEIDITYALEGTYSYIEGVKYVSAGVTKEVINTLNLQNEKLSEIAAKCNEALNSMERLEKRITSDGIIEKCDKTLEQIAQLGEKTSVEKINERFDETISAIESIEHMVSKTSELEEIYVRCIELVEHNKELEQRVKEDTKRILLVEEENSQLHSQLEEFQTQLNETRSKLDEEKLQLIGKESQLTETKSWLAETENRSQDYYNRLLERSSAAEYWENHAKRMERTKSWKITAPLRKAENIVSDIKHKKSIQFKGDIKFSIIMPVYNVEIKWLEKAINSVKNQTYSNWELCITDDASTDTKVVEFLKTIKDKRIKIRLNKKNGGISVASNDAAKMATGKYILLMDNDDEISDDALMEFYKCIKETDADVVYSDQDIIDTEGNHGCPVCKPNWSPDLFCSQMYLGHLVGFKRELFNNVGGFRKEFDGSQDYDLLLRITEKANKIEHISKILYSWRALPSSTASNPDSKPYAQYAGLNAVQDHLDRTLGKDTAKAYETDNLFVYDVKYPLKRDVLISIIIPTKDHADDLKMAIDSIFDMSSYQNFEIIILNNNSEKTETYQYFDEVTHEHNNVRVEEAFYEFNWSKLNNHGIRLAKGEVYLFLNNDVKVLTHDWLERLASQALRPEVGAVGAMLLYDDGTIQHGGVVVGFGGWADHVYKGIKPVHNGTPYISPVLTRNVTAVTGACMAISKDTIEKIGLFDDNFIICGSDVEICIRALQKGFVNVYDPYVRLYHYESKSRGTFVPQIDFELSDKMYAPFRESGDPYYNNNLDYQSLIPKLKTERVQELVVSSEYMNVGFPEITPIHFRKVELEKKRLNILLPSLNPEHVFGGIATAYKFFQEMQKRTDMDYRIILVDAKPNDGALSKYGDEYVFADSNDDTEYEKSIIPFNDRLYRTLPVSDKDYFILTGWWTAYCIQEEYLNWTDKGLSPNPFIYFIQDYEPGFYAWSSLYLLADSTYRTKFDQIAVFNSSELKDYFDFLGYQFKQVYVFDPILNAGLKERLNKIGSTVKKKKQILIYGRPNTDRNAFSLVVEALRKWVWIQDNVSDWCVVSAGEEHKKVDLGNGMILESVGKLTISEYAKTLEESYAGISLMVSPHPSYPPLEMSVFGVRVITNSYANKDMSKFNDNIISLSDASPTSIAYSLKRICDNYKSETVIDLEKNAKYCFEEDNFPFIDEICDRL